MQPDAFPTIFSSKMGETHAAEAQGLLCSVAPDQDNLSGGRYFQFGYSLLAGRAFTLKSRRRHIGPVAPPLTTPHPPGPHPLRYMSATPLTTASPTLAVCDVLLGQLGFAATPSKRTLGCC